MSELLKKAARKSLHTIEMPYDAAKRRVKRRLDLYEPVKILSYDGFGSRDRCHLLGRVLEDREIGTASDDDPWWKNAASMVRRFRTDEIPGCELQGTMYGQTRRTKTDSEGYFRLEFENSIPDSTAELNRDELWHNVDLRLLERVSKNQPAPEGTGKILIPPADAEFGVISDIDDTILQSSAHDLFRLVKLTLFNNAYTRTPFPKVASFYQALQRGSGSRRGPNPIFYVSSSAWNIFDLLSDFIRVQEIPEGPILLRDLGIDSNKFLKSGHEHKLEKIEGILEYYPDMPFILVGDSGQRDPWLYRQAVHDFPGRIAAIYIRDIDQSRHEEVEAIARELKQSGVDMLLMKDAGAAREHAESRGLISTGSAHQRSL